jgi:hypothetical protein
MVTKSLLAKDRKSNGSHKGAHFVRVATRSIIAALLGATMLVAFAGTGAYAVGIIPTLGAASPYVILGAASSASAGLSNVTGDLGLTSSTSTGASASSVSSGLLGTGLLSSGGLLAGSLLGGVSGATTTNNSAAALAEGAAAQAYQVIDGESPTHALSGGVVRSVMLSPGIYAVAGSLQLAGRVVLDARGDSGADFIFQIPSDLTTSRGAQIVLGAGAEASNVVWQVGGGADLAPATSFAGTILSKGSITLGSGSKLVGRALSLAGAVNLTDDSNALPLVGAVVSAAGSAASAGASVAVPTTLVRATNGVSEATPSIGTGARISLPLSSVHGLDLSTPNLSKIPGAGSSILGAGGVPTGLSVALPFIPLQGIGVPALAVPTLGVPTIPIANLGLPGTDAPTALPSASLSAAPAVGLPFIPLQGIGVPALAVPTLGVPTIPIASLGLPAVGVPTATLPNVTSAAVPSLPLSGIPLPALTLPSSVPSSVTLPGVSAPASAPGLSTLPLPLSGISLPQLTSPSALTPSGTPLPQLALPALTLPSISSGSLRLPALSVTPSTSIGSGKIVHPRVKESSSAHSSAAPHAKSSASSAPASSTTIPVGAPQTGFGGMAGSDPQLLVVFGALLLALCAGSLAIRSRRIQHG